MVTFNLYLSPNDPSLLPLIQIFAQKHATEEGTDWIGGNYAFYRMHHISDIYFVGGFGTVQWVDLPEFLAATPDSIVINRMQVTLQVCYMMCMQFFDG